MADLQIEDLLNGVATGNYLPTLGSQFGSLWGFDGLTVREATPEECAAFGASSRIRLGHGRLLTWLGKEWSPILKYNRQKLDQINIHTDANDATFTEVRGRLETVLGEAQELSLPQDAVKSVTRRFAWNGRGGVVSLIRTPTYIQISIGTTDSSSTSAGCLGVFLVIASGLSVVGSFA